MKRSLSFVLLMACAGAVISACGSHSENEGEAGKAREITVDETPAEIKIPRALWDEIEGKEKGESEGGEKREGQGHGEAKAEGAHGAAKEGEGGGEAEGAGGKDASDSGALFMPVDVILTEKNEGVLTQPSIRIHLPRGGGAIDLAPLRGKNDGSFFVSFAFPDLEDAKDLQSFFVSKTRARRLGDEKWGAGCGHAYRITKALDEQLKHGGLKVNTTRNRHLTVLGGHFIFSSRKNGQTFLTQVTLKDNRYGNLYCEEL